MHRFSCLESLIGNTPLLEISLSYNGEDFVIYAKAEYTNYSGSIKDRVVLNILKRAYEDGCIAPNDVIMEATSGNTGISLAAIGAFLGHKVKIFMPEWMSEERKKLILSFGAELREVTKQEGGFSGSVELATEESKKGGVFLPCQFENQNNVLAHCDGTAKELASQLNSLGKDLDGFVCGVGTGGTAMGVYKYFKQSNPNFKIFPLEPDTSAVMSGSSDLREHKILGIGDGFIPPIVDMSQMDEVVVVNEYDAILMAKMLARSFGLGVGISSGANLIGAIKASKILGSSKVIATVFSDDNKKYLSTDYCKCCQPKEDFISNGVVLKSMSAYRL